MTAFFALVGAAVAIAAALLTLTLLGLRDMRRK